MSLPRILVVDDQYARDVAERSTFLNHAHLLLEGKNTGARRDGFKYNEAVAEVVICSGQRRNEKTIINDYAVIHGAVAAEDDWALVLLDVRFDSGLLNEYNLPAGQPGDENFGEVVRDRLAQDFPDLPIVMLSSMGQRELGDQQVSYLSKTGLESRQMSKCLLEHGRLSSGQTRRLLGLASDIVANSGQTVSVFRDAFIHAGENVSILILGESGSGKEVLARYVHRSSERQGPFIAVNVAAIPKDLLESELFGVAKGAATGVGERPGKFELAGGGTLFLDEIGDMPLDAQAKVLRALQEREVYRVGGSRSICLDIRLITATSKDIPHMISDGKFREDLYYRINAVPLSMPSLRQRPEDILPMAGAFLQRFMADSGKTGITLSTEAENRLQQHAFPGNVRELENLIQRIVSGTGNNRVISGDEISEALISVRTTSSARQQVDSSTQFNDRLEITLNEFSTLIAAIRIDMNDPALVGAKPKLESAFKELLQRLAGAALERCRDPLSGTLNRQRAMQLLTGDAGLKGKAPARVINEISGRKQDSKVSDQDMEELVAAWRGEAGAVDESRKKNLLDLSGKLDFRPDDDHKAMQ